MASRTKNSWRDIEFPSGGMNTISAPYALRDQEARDILNFITFEPGQLRARNGWEAVGDLTSEVGSNRVFNVLPYRNKFLVFHGSGWDTFHAPYYLGADLDADSGFDTNSLSGDMTFVDASDPDSISVSAYGGWENRRVGIDRPLVFEHAVFWTTAERYTVTASDGSSHTGTELRVWAGSNNASETTNITINAGDRTGSVTSSLGKDLTGMFFTEGPASATTFTYQVKSHDDSTGDIELWKPYGLGEHSTNLSSASVTFNAHEHIRQSNPEVQCVGVHSGHLLVGRPKLISSTSTLQAGSYPCAIQWSEEPYNPFKWNDVDFAVVNSDPNDAIMGFMKVGDTTVVATRKHLYQLNGYSRDTFQLDNLETNIGLLDSRSIVEVEGGAFFMSQHGYMLVTNRGVEDVSHPASDQGVKYTLMDQVLAGRHDTYDVRSMCISASLVRRDHIVVQAQDLRSTGEEQNAWAYHLKTGAWVKWGNATAGQPWVFVDHIHDATYAIHEWGISKIEDIFGPEPDTLSELQDRKWDEYYSGGAQTTYIPLNLQFRDQITDHGEFGVWNVRVAHNVQYVNGASQEDTQQGIDVKLAFDDQIDADFDSYGIPPRLESSIKFGRHYQEDLRSLNFPGYGSVLRINLNNQVASTHRPDLTRLYSIRVEMQPVGPERVDDGSR